MTRSQSTFGPNATACERGNWGSLSSRPTRHSSCTHDHATSQFRNMVRTIENAFLCRTSGKDHLLSLRSVLSSVCFLTVLDDATVARAQVFTCDPVHTATFSGETRWCWNGRTYALRPSCSRPKAATLPLSGRHSISMPGGHRFLMQRSVLNRIALEIMSVSVPSSTSVRPAPSCNR